MKSVRVWLAAAAATLLAAGPAAALDGVVASIKPIHSLVAGVMEGVGQPALLVQGGASPHTYALRPTDAEALQSAKLVFWIGPALEAFLEKPLGTLSSGATVVELDEAPGMTLLAIREGGAFETDDDGDVEGPFNAHIWLDPENARAMVGAIAAALAQADPGNADRYRANAQALEKRLDGLESEVAETVEPVKGRGFIVYHDAYQYFENRFGLAAAGSITVSPETAPGAARIAEIREKIEELGAACVFTEPEFEPKIVDVTIEGTGARRGVLDPLGAELEDGPDLYFDLLANLADSLRQCLSDAG
jgi:zinc transport system substrate-binding protein